MREDFELSPPNGSSVEIWLNQRLPFSGHSNGRDCKARGGLRKALQQLTYKPDLLLSASYASAFPDRSGCDVENVLFYNVGSEAFKGIARNGLRFERLRGAPEISPKGVSFTHYQRYCFIEAPERPTTNAYTFFEFKLDGITSSIKPDAVWWAASDATVWSSAPIRGTFELRVELGTS
jgi:hypothetical protein